MINEWKLKSADIVIPVLSGITNHKPLKNLKMTEKLKSGIKNVCIDQRFKRQFMSDLGSKCIESLVHNQRS